MAFGIASTAQKFNDDIDGMGSVGLIIGATIGQWIADSGVDPAKFTGPILSPGYGWRGAEAKDLKTVFKGTKGNVLVTVSRFIAAHGPDISALAQATEAIAIDVRQALYEAMKEGEDKEKDGMGTITASLQQTPAEPAATPDDDGTPRKRLVVLTGPAGVGKEPSRTSCARTIPASGSPCPPPPASRGPARSMVSTTGSSTTSSSPTRKRPAIFSKPPRSTAWPATARPSSPFRNTSPKASPPFLRSTCKVPDASSSVPRSSGLEVVYVFIAPPSFDELVRRLKGRGTETPEEVAKRLETAHVELSAENEFDVTIVNDDVDKAAEDLWRVIASEYGITGDRRAAHLTAGPLPLVVAAVLGAPYPARVPSACPAMGLFSAIRIIFHPPTVPFMSSDVGPWPGEGYGNGGLVEVPWSWTGSQASSGCADGRLSRYR